MPQDPVEVILIPEDSRDPLAGAPVDPDDGGYSSLYGILAGEPDELGLRADLVAFVCESAIREGRPRNNRATLLLAPYLPSGGWVAGDCVIAGQQPDGGLVALPGDTTLASLAAQIEALA